MNRVVPVGGMSPSAIPPAPPAARSQEESGALRRLDLPRDELYLVALLLAYPSLAKVAAANVIEAITHPGLAQVARVLVGVVRDRPRSNPERVTAMALQDASRSLRLAVCEAALALGEVRNPHGELAALADRIGACSRCRSRSWRLALTTATGRICLPCIRRRRFVSDRPKMSGSVSPGGGAA